jgi:cytochrome P450
MTHGYAIAAYRTDWIIVPAGSTASPPLPWGSEDPYAFYERRRQDGNVVWDNELECWLALGYHAAREVLGGPGWTSDPLANPVVRGAMSSFDPQLLSGIMLFAQGDNHTRLRGSVRDVFTPSFVDGLATGVHAIGADVIGHPKSGTPFDFMTEIALPLPIAVTSEWLGFDAGSSRVLRRESLGILRLLSAGADDEDIAAGVAAFATLVTEFLPLAADRRCNPGEDLLSFIASDPDLALDDVVMTAILIAVAGHEIANLLGAAVTRLLTVGSDRTRIADDLDTSDPSLVTELLRLDGPVQATTMRTATEDRRIGDVEISAGQQVLAVIAAANRDPAVFDQPDEFRLGRAEPAPLSFGYGAHRCLGAALARLEITVAMREVLARNPELVGPVVWHDTAAIRGPVEVPMVFN